MNKSDNSNIITAHYDIPNGILYKFLLFLRCPIAKRAENYFCKSNYIMILYLARWMMYLYYCTEKYLKSKSIVGFHFHSKVKWLRCKTFLYICIAVCQFQSSMQNLAPKKAKWKIYSKSWVVIMNYPEFIKWLNTV